MSKYESENDGYRWILTAIDVFSRYFFAIPIRRKHKEFTVNAIKRSLDQFEDRFEQLPRVVQMDEGGEFENTMVLPLLEEKGIQYFSTRLTSKKAAIVERTLKTRMWKFFNYEGKKEWIYALESLVQGINQSVNRTIGMAPEDVSERNSALVYTRLYGHPSTLKQPSYKVGDLVLLSKYSNPLAKASTFKKGYKANFTRENYTISKVDKGDPNLYSLVNQDNEDEPILGRFYSQELTMINGEP